LKEVLCEADSKHIIIFAAAGNDGRNLDIPFPASLDIVFCVGATDGHGNRKSFSPPQKGVEKYSTLGEAVSAASNPDESCKCNPCCYSSERRDGTSTATPIAAGIAALFIDYTRSLNDPTYYAGNRESMRKLLLKMSEGSGGSSYRYLTPWRLGNLSQRAEFCESIKDIIKSPPGHISFSDATER
jgi:subtilisin family serine protease